MVYLGKEQPVKWDTGGIVDPTTLQMYLSSQKDLVNALYNDYKEAKQDWKDFTENYGNFISPFTKDMERYSEIMNGIKGAIDEAYARGIDPLRSPEGHLLIRRLTRSVDPGEFNMMRANAKTGFEYLDALRDLQKNGGFNQGFEDFTLQAEGLPLFKDFATKGSDGRLSSWGRSSPTEYKDLNKYTTHVFDALKDSFLRTEGPYDYYGVSEDNLRASLTPDTLGGLLNTALGRFHYNNAINDLLSRGITNPTDAQKMHQFRENIVAANHEKVREDRRINEIWKMQQEDASRMRAARVSADRNQPTNTPQWSFMEVLRRNTAANAAGKTIQDWGVDGKTILSTQRDAQIKFGKQVSKNTNGKSNSYSGINQFVDRYERVKYDPSALVSFLIGSNYKYVDGKPVPRWNIVDNNTIRIYSSDAGRIYSKGEVTSNTTGFRGNRRSTNRKLFEDADYIDVTFNGGVYGAYMKDATNENYFRIQKITVGKQDGVEWSLKNGAVPKYKKTVVRNGNDFYFDSHIKSTQDDPRAGYLGTVDKKTGKVNDTKGITVTNTQDQRLMDAVQGDVYMSEIDTNGTGYDYSVTLPELLGFGQPK